MYSSIAYKSSSNVSHLCKSYFSHLSAPRTNPLVRYQYTFQLLTNCASFLPHLFFVNYFILKFVENSPIFLPSKLRIGRYKVNYYRLGYASNKNLSPYRIAVNASGNSRLNTSLRFAITFKSYSP